MANLNNAFRLFEKRVTESEQIVSSVEALWQTAPADSQIRMQIKEEQLAALYEMAYLSFFGHWENFIEDCAVRMTTGQGSPSYSVVIVTPPRPRTLAEGRIRVLNGARFLLWYDPIRSADRIEKLVTGSPLEAMLRTETDRISEMASIRHAIAHQSEDAFATFRATSLSLVGVEHKKPGELLRALDHSDPLNPTRWLRRLTTDLRAFAVRATT